MSIGCICYATSRGLGHLTRDFHQHSLIDEVMVVEHGRVPTNWDWYPGAPSTHLQRLDYGKMRAFCRNHRAMVFFETPFDWGVFAYCRSYGIKTFLVTMYECTPRAHPAPDVYLCPSLLDYDYFTREEYRGATALYTPLPVEYPWKLRTKAEHFVHNGGYLGVKTRQGGVQREGTTTLIEAMQYVESPIKLTIRVQENVSPRHQQICRDDDRIEYVPETVPYEELYSTGDVCVGAQRWNGCSLPLQEALASGMAVMNTDRYPMNTWLPTDLLIPVERYLKNSSIGGPYLTFDEADVQPKDVAATIDRWYGKDIARYSEYGKVYGEYNSWAALGPLWREVLGR